MTITKLAEKPDEPRVFSHLTTLHGDGPCESCGGGNIVWFTESVFWNEVMRLWAGLQPGQTPPSPILCLACFIARAESVGMQPTGWRVLPEWPWRTTAPAAG